MPDYRAGRRELPRGPDIEEGTVEEGAGEGRVRGTGRGDAPPAAAAVFVVDALLDVAVLPAFVEFLGGCRPTDAIRTRQALRTIAAEAARGTCPVSVNRLYTQLLAGRQVQELVKTGRAWWTLSSRQAGAFVAATLVAARWHQVRGDAVLLVSDAVPACVAPLAAHLGADVLLCGEPAVGPDQRLTGELPRPMIGAERVSAVRRALRSLGVDPQGCSAYVQHPADRGLLDLTGNPFVVGDHPVLLRAAAEQQWPVLAARCSRGAPRGTAEDVLTARRRSRVHAARRRSDLQGALPVEQRVGG